MASIPLGEVSRESCSVSALGGSLMSCMKQRNQSGLNNWHNCQLSIWVFFTNSLTMWKLRKRRPNEDHCLTFWKLQLLVVLSKLEYFLWARCFANKENPRSFPLHLIICWKFMILFMNKASLNAQSVEPKSDVHRVTSAGAVELRRVGQEDRSWVERRLLWNKSQNVYSALIIIHGLIRGTQIGA